MRPFTKRGVVEVQFNWIFIMIAGGLILFFFMTVISYQQQLSRQKLGVELASQLDLIFSGRGVSPGAKQPIDISDVPIQFDCNEYRVMGQRIASGNTLIFAPAEIVTKKLLTITMSFDLPFRTNTMTMMTSPQVKYYFFGFTKDMQEKIDAQLDFPLATEGEKIDYEFWGPETQTIPTYENNPFVRFVINNPDPTTPSITLDASFNTAGDDKISAVVVDENKIGDEEHPLSSPLVFFQKSGTGWQQQPNGEAYTLGFPSFIGAVFTKDGTTYQCLMDRTLHRAQQVVGIAKDCADQLQKFYATFHDPNVASIETDQCRTIAGEGFAALQALEQGLTIPPGGVIDTNQLTDLLTTVRDINKQAVLATCPAFF